MVVIAIIGVIIIIIWAYYSNSSSNSSRTSINAATYKPTIVDKSTSINNASPSISISPSNISIKPELKISLVDGEYRYFENHYINGRQYSFGFPKANCPDKRVWVGIGNQEIDRISYTEAMRRIRNKNYISTKSINYIENDGYFSKQKIGYCYNCNKKLRGNIYKKYCTVCYYNGCV